MCKMNTHETFDLFFLMRDPICITALMELVRNELNSEFLPEEDEGREDQAECEAADER